MQIRFIVLIIMMSLVACHSKYNKKRNLYKDQWQNIDKRIEENNPVSAESLVNWIYDEAVKEQNYLQMIKCGIYRFNLKKYDREKNPEEMIAHFTKLAADIPEPYSNICFSIIAESYLDCLFDYHRQNSSNNNYGFENRPFIDSLLLCVSTNVQKSLNNPSLLKKIKCEWINDILNFETSKYRPTLYDILMHRTIDIYTDQRCLLFEQGIFVPETEKYFCSAEEFVKLKLPDCDSKSSLFLAYKYLQELTAYILEKDNLQALLNIEHKRLILNISIFKSKEKDNMFEDAIVRLIDKYWNKKEIGRICKILSAYYEFSEFDNPEKLQKNIALAEKVIQSSLDDDTKEFFRKKLFELKEFNFWNLRFYAEKNIVPDKSFLVKISYRGIDTVYFRLYKVNEKTKQSYSEHSLLKYIDSKDIIKSGQIVLPHPNKRKMNETEYIFDALPYGLYFLAMSDKKNFNGDDYFECQYLIVAETEIRHRFTNEGLEILVQNINTGKQMPNKQITTTLTENDYRNNFVKKRF